MTELFLELLSILGIVVVSAILLVITLVVLVIIGSFVSTCIDICRGKTKKQEPYKTVAEINEPGIYMATKEGIVKIDGGEK